MKTIEAVMDENGHVHLLEPVKLPGPRRALITLLDEEVLVPNETALLAEAALSDWNRPEEDEAWQHLQQRLFRQQFDCFSASSLLRRQRVFREGARPSPE
jgi:hypothetical protein